MNRLDGQCKESQSAGKQRGKHLATGVCRVSFGSVHRRALRRIARHGVVVTRIEKQSGKPLATVVYRSVFTSQQANAVHLSAPHRTARHRIERNQKATRPALHGGLSESFSAHGTASQRIARRGRAVNLKATRQGHSMSGFVEGLSSQCIAAQGNATQGSAPHRN